MARPQVGIGHNTLTFGTSSLLSDRITKGELRAEYCPTGDMVADFFTKPLQGSLFRKLHKVILNLPGTVRKNVALVQKSSKTSVEATVIFCGVSLMISMRVR
jgi:hypothetical protein